MGSPLSLRDPGLSSASNIKTVASVNADQRRVKVTTHLTVQTNLTPRPLVENMNMNLIQGYQISYFSMYDLILDFTRIKRVNKEVP